MCPLTGVEKCVHGFILFQCVCVCGSTSGCVSREGMRVADKSALELSPWAACCLSKGPNALGLLGHACSLSSRVHILKAPSYAQQVGNRLFWPEATQKKQASLVALSRWFDEEVESQMAPGSTKGHRSY